MLDLITPDWPAPQGIKAYTTTRCGGYSLPPFNTLNLGMHVGDDTNCVTKNRQLLQNSLGLNKPPLWLQQVHGNTAISADHIITTLAADAIYSHKTQTVCTVQTADCLPLLVCSRTHHCVAAIHAGWKGLSQGIIENTIHALNSPSSDLLVWLGPAIGPKAFIVGKEVFQTFVRKDTEAKAAFHSLGKNRWHANLYQLAKQCLYRLGITAIYGSNRYCTYTDHEHFFSFRRDKVTGRMASLIWLDLE